jgi:dTMP kinase
LITFEGPEGSGKSTHARLFYGFLKRNGFNCVFTREPGGTTIGNAIRKLLLEKKNTAMSDVCELFLFEASRAQIMQEVIRPALVKGAIVVCDRFSDATVAYQGYGAGLNKKRIAELNRLATANVTPDITILLDVEPREGLRRTLKRRRPDRMESKALRFHRRLRNGYLRIARAEPRRVKVIRSVGDITTIQHSIRTVIMSCLSKR